MTPATSYEILTPFNAEGERGREGEKEKGKLAHNDGLKAHPPNPPQWGNSFDGISRTDVHDVFATPDEDENPNSTCHGMSLY